MRTSSVNISNKHIGHIAQALDCDMICFMNPYTCEIEDVPHDVLSGMYHDETWQEILNRVDQWENYITIDRPDDTESAEIMKSFIDEYIPSGSLKEQLNDVMALRRPDKNFHRLVEKSDYREKWTVYSRHQMKKHICKQLRDNRVV